jgi:hypothetical protein
MKTAGGSLNARVYLNGARGGMGDYYTQQGRHSKFAVLFAKVQRIDIVGPGDELVASINPGTLPPPETVATRPASASLDPGTVALTRGLARRFVDKAITLEVCSPGSSKAMRSELGTYLASTPELVSIAFAEFDKTYATELPKAQLQLRSLCGTPRYQQYLHSILGALATVKQQFASYQEAMKSERRR